MHLFLDDSNHALFNFRSAIAAGFSNVSVDNVEIMQVTSLAVNSSGFVPVLVTIAGKRSLRDILDVQRTSFTMFQDEALLDRIHDQHSSYYNDFPAGIRILYSLRLSERAILTLNESMSPLIVNDTNFSVAVATGKHISRILPV